MKYYFAVTLLMLGCAVDAAPPTTNHLAIYLVDTKIFHPWPAASPGALKTISPAVLADSDFVSFDVTNQTFVITATAAKRLARKIWDLGKQDAPGWGNSPTILQGGRYDLIPAPAPFVLKAMDQPVYTGAFYTGASSSMFAGPVVLSDVLFISTNLTGTVPFRIELGYPVTIPGVTDPRDDVRIKSAVQQLFAHEKK